MPIYVVRPKEGDEDLKKHRLVMADNPAQALRHVAQDTLTVAIAGVEQSVELGAAGVKVENAAS